MSYSIPPPEHPHTWAELLTLVGAIRRLAYDRSLDDSDRARRIRDRFGVCTTAPSTTTAADLAGTSGRPAPCYGVRAVSCGPACRQAHPSARRSSEATSGLGRGL